LGTFVRNVSGGDPNLSPEREERTKGVRAFLGIFVPAQAFRTKDSDGLTASVLLDDYGPALGVAYRMRERHGRFSFERVALRSYPHSRGNPKTWQSPGFTLT